MIWNLAIAIVWILVIATLLYLVYHSMKMENALSDDVITARIAARNTLDLEHIHLFLKDMSAAVKSIKTHDDDRFQEMVKTIDSLETKVGDVGNAKEAIASIQKQLRELTERSTNATTTTTTSRSGDNGNETRRGEEENASSSISSTDDPWSLLVGMAAPLVERLVSGLKSPVLWEAAASLASSVSGRNIEMSQPPQASSQSSQPLSSQQPSPPPLSENEALQRLELQLKNAKAAMSSSSSSPEPPPTPPREQIVPMTPLPPANNVEMLTPADAVPPLSPMTEQAGPEDLSNSIGNQLMFFVNEDFSGEVEQVPSKNGVTVRVGALDAFRAMYVPDGVQVVFHTPPSGGDDGINSDPYTSGTHVIPELFTSPGSYARVTVV